MIIEIWTKEKYAASEEAGLIKTLGHSGLAVKNVRLSRLYKIDGDYTNKELNSIASELLVDRITERYTLSGRKHGLKGACRAEIWLKDSVTDAVGETVMEAVAEFAGRPPLRVRFGHAYYATCASQKKFAGAVSRTLANEIVNVCRTERA